MDAWRDIDCRLRWRPRLCWRKNISCCCRSRLRVPGEFVTMPVTQHFDSHLSIIGALLNRKVVVSNQGDLVQVRISG